MNIRIPTNKKEYYELWVKNKAHFLQSWAWGEIKKPKWTPLRLVFDDILACQVLMRKIPLTRGTFGYVPKFINTQSLSSIEIHQILKFLKGLGLGFVLFESENEINSSLLGNSGFTTKLTKTIQPQYSSRIDLKDSYEDIFARFSSTYRRKSRKAEKLGLIYEIFTNEENALDRFFLVMQNIMDNTKFVMHQKEYFKNVWKNLSSDVLAQIYIATKDGIDVGALFVVHDEQGVYELYGGVNEQGRKFPVGVYLRNKVLQNVTDSGFSYYDFWGVAELFKQKFGGENIAFPKQIIIIFRPLSYLIYSLMVGINKLRIKLKKILKNNE